MFSRSHLEPIPLDDGDRAVIGSVFQPILNAIGSDTDPVIVAECLLHAVQHGGDWSAAPAVAGRRATLLAEIEQLCAAGAIESLALEFEQRGDSLVKAGIHWTCRRFRLIASCRALYPVFRSYPIEPFLRAIVGETSEKSSPFVSKLSPQVALGNFYFNHDRLCRGVVPKALKLMALGLNEGVHTMGVRWYLKEHEWWEWPANERRVLQEFVEASWLAFLSRCPCTMWDERDCTFVDEIFLMCPPDLGSRQA